MVPSDIWNGLGALLIASALLTSHPIRSATIERLGSEIASNWQLMMQEDGCTRSTDSCMMLPMAMPTGKN